MKFTSKTNLFFFFFFFFYIWEDGLVFASKATCSTQTKLDHLCARGCRWAHGNNQLLPDVQISPLHSTREG